MDMIGNKWIDGFLLGMNVKKAYTYLSDVVEHKQVVPFRRFNGSIGRASQAKAFGETKGGFLDCLRRKWQFWEDVYEEHLGLTLYS